MSITFTHTHIPWVTLNFDWNFLGNSSNHSFLGLHFMWCFIGTIQPLKKTHYISISIGRLAQGMSCHCRSWQVPTSFNRIHSRFHHCNMYVPKVDKWGTTKHVRSRKEGRRHLWRRWPEKNMPAHVVGSPLVQIVEDANRLKKNAWERWGNSKESWRVFSASWWMLEFCDGS